MLSEQKLLLPAYDFSGALLLTVSERLEQSVEILQARAQTVRLLLGEETASFQTGLSENELAALQQEIGASIPVEYAEFLRRWREIEGDTGLEIFGQSAWPTDEDYSPKPYLVIGNYFRYADGDQLLMPLADVSEEVLLYLHAAGPKMEAFAPSFSLALWRLAHEEF